MPWIRSKDALPPKNVELQLFKDGKRWKGKLDTFDIVNGFGGMSPNIPDFWAYPEKDLRIRNRLNPRALTMLRLTHKKKK